MALTTTSPSTVHGRPARVPAKWRGSGRRQREGVAGYVFLAPWLLGLMGITALPMVLSLYLSFTDYDTISPISSAQWIGLANYRKMFTGADPHYLHAVRVTITYAVVAIPLKLSAALAVALLLNKAWRGIAVLRGLFYLPSLLGGSVALAIVWYAMFSRDGSFNALLEVFGITGRPWVNDPDTALGTIVLLGVWQFGSPMVIFLAGLKQIPTELYEASWVDGAGRFRSFWHITLPILSPVIFFNLVLETIHGFQGFTGAFVISNGKGGPVDSTMLYTIYLYLTGFRDFQMGYAAAMAWVFLVAVGMVTAVLFSTGRFWVHYGDDR